MAKRLQRLRVVLSSVLPVYDFPWRRGLEPAPKVAAFTAWIREYAESNGFVYVDYHSAMADARQGLLSRSRRMASIRTRPATG